ncbi:MAG: inositol-1-monophosphatase [Pseudomonadota bacterium]
MHPMLNIAVRAARRAGSIIVRSARDIDRLTIEAKGHNDFVSEVDRAAEEAIIDIIHKAYPDHGFMAEESGDSGSSDYQWIIDPLDGTTNFLHGFPQFAVSIALRHGNRLEQAVVYDPMREEMYTASRGSGAQLDGQRLRVAPRRQLEGSLLGTGFPFKQPEHLDAYLGMFRAFHPLAAGIRRPGSAALDLAYVAAGRLDGFWEIGLNPWDMAAGVLLVREAGGLVSDFDGGEEYLATGNLVAATPKIFPSMIHTIDPHRTPALMK